MNLIGFIHQPASQPDERKRMRNVKQSFAMCGSITINKMKKNQQYNGTCLCIYVYVAVLSTQQKIWQNFFLATQSPSMLVSSNVKRTLPQIFYLCPFISFCLSLLAIFTCFAQKNLRQTQLRKFNNKLIATIKRKQKLRTAIHQTCKDENPSRMARTDRIST